jgi:hypothetical protein
MGQRLIEKGNEKFDNAGQFERSRCWAVPGNAFAGVGRSWVVGVGVWRAVQASVCWAWASGRFAQTERSAAPERRAVV